MYSLVFLNTRFFIANVDWHLVLKVSQLHIKILEFLIFKTETHLIV